MEGSTQEFRGYLGELLLEQICWTELAALVASVITGLSTHRVFVSFACCVYSGFSLPVLLVTICSLLSLYIAFSRESEFLYLRTYAYQLLDYDYTVVPVHDVFYTVFRFFHSSLFTIK
jgi:hypothetical protein